MDPRIKPSFAQPVRLVVLICRHHIVTQIVIELGQSKVDEDSVLERSSFAESKALYTQQERVILRRNGLGLRQRINCRDIIRPRVQGTFKSFYRRVELPQVLPDQTQPVMRLDVI